MAINNIIPGQAGINVRYFYLGAGAYDSKLAVLTLAELNDLIFNVGSFYTDGDLIWVSETRQHYVISVDENEVPTYAPADIGNSGPITPPVAGTGFMWYGGQQNVYDYTESGTQAAKPSTLGYGNNDLIISSGGVTNGASGYDQYNVWRVEITNFVEAYNFEGSIKGSDGGPGVKGEKGDKGESFNVNGQGTYIERPLCSDVGEGYSWLVTNGFNSGLIYFAIVPTNGDACSWSIGVPFGKGDPGASVWTVFRRSITALGPGDQPSDNLVQENVDKGWTDNVPPEDANPATDDLLYMSQATYAITDDTAIPPITAPDVFVWTSPILVEGERGLDGREGSDAGFWVVWSEQQSKPAPPTNKPEKDSGGGDSWVADANQSWFDDIDYNDPDKNIPRWMAQIPYDNNTGLWKDWIVSQIGGEKPPYKLNIFSRQAAKPSSVTTSIPYTQTDGTFTTGAEAAVLVNIDPAGDSTIWTDAPPPPGVIGERLWFIEVSVTLNGPNTEWTVPVEVDGAEGAAAGIWSVWTNNNAIGSGDLPFLDNPNNIIDDTVIPPTINLTTSPGWVDESDGFSVWMANSYYRSGTWTPWTYMKVKGEKGDKGANFTVNAQGTGAPTPSMYCTESEGFSYLDTNTSLLYFKTTSPSSVGCSNVGWTTGTPFGKGDGGNNYYNIFSAAPSTSPPAKPVDDTTIEQAVELLEWNDSPPTVLPGQERLWMTSTNYSKTSDGVVIGTITWSTPIMLDGEEGAASGYWAVWSVYETPIDLPYVKTLLNADYTQINLTGTQWIDDTIAATAPVIWMATAYYRPAKPGEEPSADPNGRIWTEWVYVKVLGEDGIKGDTGNSAYSYVPSTMFSKQNKDINLGNNRAYGGCLKPTGSGGFYIDVPGGAINIGGSSYTFQDGIPTTTNNEVVWMIQGVMNSNDDLCPGSFDWGFATILRDTSGMDYEYARGQGNNPPTPPPTGEPGTKPPDPDADPSLWYSNPDLVPGGAFWLAQKNWSEGPSAPWRVYQIRGEDGQGSTPSSPPAKVTGVGHTGAGYGRVTITWSASTDPDGDLDHYQIQIVNNGDIFDTTQLSRHFEGLSPIILYKFKVRAVDSKNNYGPWSDEYIGTPLLDDKYTKILEDTRDGTPCSVDRFDSTVMYYDIFPLAIGTILYTNSVLTDTLEGGNTWWTVPNGSIMYNITNEGLVLSINNC